MPSTENKVEIITQKKTNLRQKDSGETTKYPTSVPLIPSSVRTDVGYFSSFSSPPSFCIRLAFFCVLISTLFPFFFHPHPYMYIQWLLFTKKLFLPNFIHLLCASCTDNCEVKIGNTASSHNRTVYHSSSCNIVRFFFQRKTFPPGIIVGPGLV